MEFDVILENGTVIDGSGRPAFRADVGIRNGKIGEIGFLKEAPSLERIELGGDILCPGLVDAHCHTDMYAAQVPEAKGKIMQGVTTDVCGLCGDSPAPVGKGHLEEFKAHQTYALPGAKPLEPITLKEYQEQMGEGTATNMALFVGNANLRVHAVGYEDRPASQKEIDIMSGMLRESMEAGAFGLSTGLTYVPSGFAREEELTALCRQLAPFDGIYNSHMRNEGDQIDSAIREVIRIAANSGCRGHISHLKLSGKKNHGRAQECLKLIDDARRGGVDITFDVYPYTAGSCGLKTLLPPKILEKKIEGDQEAMMDPAVRREIREGLRDGSWDNLLLSCGRDAIVVSAAGGRKEFEGKTLGQICRELEADEDEALIYILGQTGGQASMIYYALCEEDLRTFMKHPACMIGTDAFARDYSGPTAAGRPHPRNYGGFPRMIRTYLLDEKVLGLEEGIARMTSLPCSFFQIPDRGRIEPGYWADLLVFSPDHIREKGTYMEPWKKPEGIRLVFLGGRAAVREGEARDLRIGRILRKS